jgi:hypothetical protein
MKIGRLSCRLSRLSFSGEEGGQRSNPGVYIGPMDYGRLLGLSIELGALYFCLSWRIA